MEKQKLLKITDFLYSQIGWWYTWKLEMVSSNGTIWQEYFGYVSLFISSAFYGLNHLPVKMHETGDGMFFQLIECISKRIFWRLKCKIERYSWMSFLAIWLYSIIIFWIRNFPKFHLQASLGGWNWNDSTEDYLNENIKTSLIFR